MLPSMRECFKPEESIEWNRASTSLHWYQKKIMQCDENSVTYTEEATRNQSYCDAWYQRRTGRITGSIIHQVYHTSVKNQSKSLIKKICQVHTSKLNTPAVAWGRDHEELGIKIYTDVSSNKNSQFKSKCISDVVIHTDLDVRSFGLQISNSKTMVWSFPRQCDIL